ncbi:MAG: helix-turn-helix transcriptional regulator [Tannerella sp.]|nr:helix-turn-helix transcriptional regulator [Tannerella sp.]
MRELLAHNMKERRHILNLSQYKLAERVGATTHYIGMIESRRKFPSPEMMERIAQGLEIDTPELFSMKSFPADTLKKYQKEVLDDIEEITEEVLEEKLEKLEKAKT